MDTDESHSPLSSDHKDSLWTDEDEYNEKNEDDEQRGDADDDDLAPLSDLQAHVHVLTSGTDVAMLTPEEYKLGLLFLSVLTSHCLFSPSRQKILTCKTVSSVLWHSDILRECRSSEDIRDILRSGQSTAPCLPETRTQIIALTCHTHTEIHSLYSTEMLLQWCEMIKGYSNVFLWHIYI